MNDSTSEQPQFKTCTNPDCPMDNPQPIDNFYNEKLGKDGKRAACKTCRDMYKKGWCDANSERDRTNKKAWREKNPDRTREYARQFRLKNPERYKELQRQSRNKHPETSRAAGRRYHSRHRDQINARKRLWIADNRELHNKRSSEWSKANPARKQAAYHRYAARKRSLPDNFGVSNWEHALGYFNGCCAVCGRPRGLWHTLSMDHWIPISSPDCPGTIPTNIVPLCHGDGGCNNSKLNRDPQEWLVEKFGKRKASIILKRIEDYFVSLDSAD